MYGSFRCEVVFMSIMWMIAIALLMFIMGFWVGVILGREVFR